MTKKKKKVVGISLGIVGAGIGILSIGSIAGVAKDKRNYSNEIDHIKSLDKQFDDNNNDLMHTRDNIARKVEGRNIDTDIKKSWIIF
ncbi:hypothetical protein [Mycoplasmopsis caviae]|uniref:Uncharacterized protein n=1 Tax=Mycoplasmopsis caviae TaxID=55603 RepID=A0A3P8K882_9BACT|nr:hypothetical protein [Mycoplasmopsis caviae]VDR41539.1 Uncharacterised protein [Mycoplasmopsis caviae]